jgi:DNA polymerase II large subunit
VDEPPSLQIKHTNSIWERFNDSSCSIAEPKVLPRLNQLLNFEKEFNDSLRKTKMLKSIIQRRLIDEMEDTYASRVRHIH